MSLTATIKDQLKGDFVKFIENLYSIKIASKLDEINENNSQAKM